MVNTWSGVQARLRPSGLAKPPADLYGRVGWVTEHGTGAAVQTLTADSNEGELYPNNERLVAELKTARLNGEDRFYTVVNSGPAGHGEAGNIAARIDEIRLASEVEFLAFDLEATAAFANALKIELQERRRRKQYYVAFLRFRQVIALDLGGVAAVDAKRGKVSFAKAGHGLVAGDEIILSGTQNYDGAHALLAGTNEDTLEITASFEAETLPERAKAEESAGSYQAAFAREFGEFYDDFICVVVPVTQQGHFGAVVGESAKLSVEVEAGWTGKPPLKNVAVDPVWQERQLPALKGLAEKRATLLKTHVERPAGVYVNKTQTMFGPMSDFHSVPSARVANKVLRECLFYAFPLVNSHVFPSKTEAEAKAIAQMATQGLQAMKQQGQLGGYSVSAAFAGDGVDLTVNAVDSNRITVVNETVTLTQPE